MTSSANDMTARENVPGELAEVAALAVERSLTFMGMEGTRRPGTEAVDVDAVVEMVLSTVSEAGWVRVGELDLEASRTDDFARDVSVLVRERDAAHAQADALSEALWWMAEECSNTADAIGPVPELAEGALRAHAETARDALRAYRASQEPRDAA